MAGPLKEDDLTPAQDRAFRLVFALDEPTKTKLRRWWAAEGMPSRFDELTDDQAARVRAEVEELAPPPF